MIRCLYLHPPAAHGGARRVWMMIATAQMLLSSPSRQSSEACLPVRLLQA